MKSMLARLLKIFKLYGTMLLNAQILNYNHEINTIHFIWNEEDPSSPHKGLRV